jgi:hypothetical protein
MTDSLSIGWTRAKADGRRAVYRRLFGFNLILQSLIAVFVLVNPTVPLDFLGLSGGDAEDWIRVWAGMVLLASALQLPGFLEPIFNRLPNVVGILGRLGMAILFLSLGGGFLWLAAFDAVFAVLLFLTYRRAIIAELQTRP